MHMGVRRAYVIIGIGVALIIVAVVLALRPQSTRAPTQGCTPTSTGELYVQHAYACDDGTRVLTFSDVTARDAYTSVATHYGVVIIDEGERWIRIRPL